MSLWRIFKNVAVLVILMVAVLSLLPRQTSAQTACSIPLGSACPKFGLTAQCCGSHWCGFSGRCCLPLHNMACRFAAQCCSGACIFRAGASYGACL